MPSGILVIQGYPRSSVSARGLETVCYAEGQVSSPLNTHHGFGRVEFDVVDTAAAWMDPASGEALLDDLKGHVQIHHCVYLISSIQGFCLWKCPWKTFTK